MVSINYTISILLMILIPVLLAALFRRRFPVPWLLFLAGMATFTISQIIHIPLNNLLTQWGILPQTGITPRTVWQTALVLGLTAGLCEELVRTAGFALLKRYREFEDGVMLGLGHGGIEAMIFGAVLTASTISSLLPLAGTDLSQLNLSPEQKSAVEQQLFLLLSNPGHAILPLVERLLAIAIQVVFSLIVLRAFQRHNAWYVVIAIGYHTVIDAGLVLVAGWFHNPWLIEALFLLMTLPGWIWLAILYRERSSKITSQPVPFAGLVKTFWAALNKELVQQWRTRRVLIVAAVFGLFGMASPLLAYFMPQMFTFIPGAEQFASLIPPPTVLDALTQYSKNISQFAFILAILLGMSAVAGEKERGTASLILSKPLTRTAFVLSKFFAQVILYLGGFVLALAGAYFYTIILFGSLDFALMLKITLLLLAWLLPYVAFTLLASVIGNTTSSAAGIAAVFAVLLMLIGSIPKINTFMPGALMGWANLLSSGQVSTPVNGGALALCLTLVVGILVAAVAVFEQQEL